MGSTKTYDDVHLQHYRVTLDMSVLGDFDPRQVDYKKVFDLQENEDVESYVEDLDTLAQCGMSAQNGKLAQGYVKWTYPITDYYTMRGDIDTR